MGHLVVSGVTLHNPESRDLDFWRKYHQLRKRRLPGQSNLFDALEDLYRKKRLRFNQQWSFAFDLELPSAAVDFYNDAFKQAHAAVKRLFRRHAVCKRSRDMADVAYGVRLKKGDRFSHLLALDVFGTKTVNQDILPEFVFGNVRQMSKRDPVLLADTHHFFFHRPQQSEHLFFHEIVVGFLLNEVENRGFISSPKELSLQLQGYSPYAAYTLVKLSKVLGMNPGRTAALHFESSERLTAILPDFVKDLMLISSYIYWHLDLYSKRSGRFSPSELLVFVYSFFVVPALDRQLTEGPLHLRRQAGAYVDQLFEQKLQNRKKSRYADVDTTHLYRLLFLCVEDLWLEEI